MKLIVVWRKTIVAEKDDYLLDLLVDLGFTNAEQVAQARAESGGVGVVDWLVANKVIRPADVTQAKAAQFGAEVVNLGVMKIEDDIISIIPRHIAKKYRVIPLFKNDGKVGIAIADPSDLGTIDSLTHLLDAEIESRVASEPDIEAALNKFYGGEKKALDDGIFKEVIQELTQENVHVAGPGADDPSATPTPARRSGAGTNTSIAGPALALAATGAARPRSRRTGSAAPARARCAPV